MKDSSGNYDKEQEYVPVEGFIPTEKVACQVSEAVWVGIYGERVLEKRPFKAKLLDTTIWFVRGTLSEDSKGGVPEIKISKKSGEILWVSHGK